MVFCKIVEKTLKREVTKPQMKSKPFDGMDWEPLVECCNRFLLGCEMDSSSVALRSVKAVLVALCDNLGSVVQGYMHTLPSASPARRLIEDLLCDKGKGASPVTDSENSGSAVAQATAATEGKT